MSWSQLVAMGLTLRPFDDPPPSGDTWSPFDSPFRSTLETLDRELRELSAQRIVLQVGYREQDLRIDGLPRANSRMLHDAVALSFESKWGPLRYETNEFIGRHSRRGGEGWQVNLRAIALAMEALRKVDRYGVSKRGEQYTGWKQLTSSSADDELPQTAREAAAVIHAVVEDLYDLNDVGGPHLSDAIRDALMRAHPDKGGDALTFRRVIRARELLTS